MQTISQESARAAFERSGFMGDLGGLFREAGPGWCTSELPISVRLGQQDGLVHAGVQAAMAEQTAETAAATLLEAGQLVSSVELKINLLRPAVGELLRCDARVLKSGRRLSVVECEIRCRHGAEEALASTATITLTILQ